MKQLSFILMAAIVLTSCKKSDETTKDEPLTSPGMVAKLDGTLVNFNTPTAQVQAGTGGTHTLYITGLTTEDTQVEVSLTTTKELNPGEFGEADGAHISISDASGGQYETNKIVNIKIISMDASHVVGSFIGEANGNAGVPKSVTEGKFYANF